MNGGIYGAAFKDGLFYATELENGTGDEYLNIIPHSGNAIGARVGAAAIGFPNVEALATVGNQLIASSLDFDPPHHTKLISIDCSTGIGTLIGQGSLDHMIVGLAYDPIAGVLYGVGIPFATVDGYNLFTIDPATGATTLVGEIGFPIQSLTVSPSLGLVGAFGKFYSINPATGAGTQIGTTDYTNGIGLGDGLFNGLYALASEPPVAAGIVEIVSVERMPGEQVEITWSSETGSTYQLESSATLQAGSWASVGSTMPGVALTMSSTVSITEVELFFRVVRTTP